MIDPLTGLCSQCRHASVQRSPRGSEFWRCLAAEENPRLLRYPPLPVLRCSGYERREAAPELPDEASGEPSGGKPAPSASKKI